MANNTLYPETSRKISLSFFFLPGIVFMQVCTQDFSEREMQLTTMATDPINLTLDV